MDETKCDFQVEPLMDALSQSFPVPDLERRSVLEAFQADYDARTFEGKQGQWAAYVDGRFVGETDSDEEKLFDRVRRKFPNGDIAIQPIQPIVSICMGGPRARRKDEL